MSKHTPGPWRTHLCDGTLVIDSDGVPVATTTGDYESEDEYAVMEANARLIAVAPDMLAALKAVVEFSGAHGGPYAAARAAIKKATGEP